MTNPVQSTLNGIGQPKGGGTGAPGAPDPISAYQAGVNADTQSLAQRRLIDTAAQLGYVYMDGKILTPDQYQQHLDFNNQKLADAQARGDVGAANEARTALNAGSMYDFRGAGSADIAQKQLLQELAGADATTQANLDLEKKYGTQYTDQARKELEALDPTGFALHENTGKALNDGSNSIESLYAGGPTAPTYERFDNSQLPQYDRLNQGDAPTFSRLGDGPQFDTLGRRELPRLNQLSQTTNPNFTNVDRPVYADTGQAAAGRGLLEQQTFDELAKAGQPDEALQRSAEQAARARGASTGNILGDSSALQESLQVQLAQRGLDSKRRGDALNLLQSGQTTSDKANALRDMQLQGDVASAGFNNQNAQQRFQNTATINNTNNDVAQQSFANRAQQAEFNNTVGQQGFANSVTKAGFNNDTSQNEFANRAQIAGFNNNIADQSFNAAMAAIQQRNQASQNQFAGQQSQVNQRAQARQQDQANVQSFLGLTPVVGQAAQLGNIGQGAAPFNPGNVQPGDLSNPNAGLAGMEWAGQLYGAQNQLFAGQQAAGAAKSAGQTQAAGAVASAAIPIIIAI